MQNERQQRSTVYRRPGHFSPLENMRLQGILCDVTIEVEQATFKAHKCILAATTRYFQNMFTNNFEANSQNIISLKDVSAANMEAFITFAYIGHITVTEDNVQSLMQDADYLELIDIKDECIQFLESCLHAQNVFDAHRLGEELSCVSLQDKSKLFMRQHFRDFSLTDDYVDLDIKLLKDLLCSDEVQTYPQISIFESVMKWIMIDVNERKIYLTGLLRLVRLSDISSESLIDYFFQNDGVSELFCRVMFTYRIQKNYLQCNKNEFFVMHEANANIIESYNPVSDVWTFTAVSNGTCRYFSATAHKDRLYTFGGRLEGKAVATVQVYEPENKIWERLSSMTTERWRCGVVGLNDFLYVCGGRNADCANNAVERYCPESDEWKTMSSMNQYRVYPAIVAFQGYIYAIGGHDDKSVLTTIERYDPRTDRWTSLDLAMKQKRGNCGVAVLNGMIYVCGGNTEVKSFKIINSVEAYDPETDRWKDVASMDTARCGFFVVSSMGKLWALGGFNGEYCLSSVEVYDPVSDSWSYAKPMERISGWVTGGIVSSS